ncbi:hypothetical protein DOTSEDRAFT_33237 [Dothistroma septosporum NZE10]|uniref:HNH nuclease domain-containing protein n=1 Tax=Dothistroma septosporum (strain NZE10 / CBS 128990) TaxID=675120 RepID=N1PTG3_DOTSN|nr:hypothetical protein DOTSEDRAFT_33237 [Dothistroma septosporum NZE10]
MYGVVPSTHGPYMRSSEATGYGTGVTFDSLRRMYLAASNSTKLVLSTDSIPDHQEAVRQYGEDVRQSLWPIKDWLNALMRLLLADQAACCNMTDGKRLERQVRGVQEYIHAIEIELLELQLGYQIMRWRLEHETQAYLERVKYWASQNLIRATTRRLAVQAMDSNVNILNDDTLQTFPVPRSDVDDRHQTREMLKTYDVVRRQQSWCSVTKRFWSRREHKKVHIVPVVYGAVDVARLFGEQESKGVEIIYDPLNTLPLMGMIAEWLEEFKMTIVPSRHNSGLGVWGYRLVILDWVIADTVIMHKAGAVITGDLHKKELRFRNTKRPKMRCLAAHWLMALDLRTYTKRERYRLDGRAAGIASDLRLPWQHLWTPWEPCLDVGVLRAWAELACLVGPDEPPPEWMTRIGTTYTCVTADTAKDSASELRRRALMHAAVPEDDYMLLTEHEEEGDGDADI